MEHQSRARELSLTKAPAAVLLHQDGFIGLFLDDNGDLYAEVSGFKTQRGHEFIGKLEQFADVGPDIYVSLVAPQWGLADLRHYRR